MEEQELETTVGGRNVSSQPEKIIFKEYLQARCRISYRMRKLKTKGAILVLIWNFMVMSVLYYLLDRLLVSYHDSVGTCVMTIIGVILPVAGWLADVRFGRYRVMRCNIWIMWISSVLVTVVYVVFSFIEFNWHSSLMLKILTILLAIILAFGIGGFQAIVIQFGVDQLNDASTTEITSFVAWYTWMLISSNIVSSFINIIICIDSKYNLIGPLVIAMCLTVVVITNYLFSNQLIKEPVTQNPFKLIYKVVRYAIKTKHPQQRSAFTYWEDNLPSRMDFGKIKYGGPFTTEQVEDVKILFKTFGVIFIVSFLTSLNLSFLEHELYITYLTKLFSNHHSENIFYHCFGKDFLTNVRTVFGLFLVPSNEFLIYPLFYRCISIKIRWKILLGTLLQLAGLIVIIILITYTRSKYIENITHPHNYTLQCLFHEESNSLTNDIIDYRWFILAEFLFAASDTMNRNSHINDNNQILPRDYLLL